MARSTQDWYRFASAAILLVLLIVGPWISIARSRAYRSILSSHQLSRDGRSDSNSIDLVSIVAPHLERSEERSLVAIDSFIRPVDELFQESKRHTREFAEVCLGWGSKWRIVADKIPGTRGDRHQEFLRAEFEKMFFSSETLVKTIESSITGYMKELHSIDGQTIVAIRADIADLPQEFAIKQWNEAHWQTSFQEAIDRVQERAGEQVRSDVTSQVVSLIVGEIFTHIAIRLGVSAGILSAGTVSGSVSLGVGVVVGLIIDQIVATVWDWWSDPKGDLAKELNQKLEITNILIRNGDSQVPGLIPRFKTMAEERSRLRRMAIQSMITPVKVPEPKR